VNRLIFNQILGEVLSSLRLQVSLADLEKESLYTEAVFYFGVVGAYIRVHENIEDEMGCYCFSEFWLLNE